MRSAALPREGSITGADHHGLAQKDWLSLCRLPGLVSNAFRLLGLRGKIAAPFRAGEGRELDT